MKITHVIIGLNRGGAENALYRLVTADPDPGRFHVISLLDEGVYGPKLIAAGARVTAVHARSTLDVMKSLARVTAILRKERPDVVQTWMYHADLIGGLAARALRIPVSWGVRQSSFDPQRSKRMTRAIARACALLSGTIPSAIVACAARAEAAHREFGYSGTFFVIPNGLDLDALRPDPKLREDVRRELGIPSDAELVGHVGRADPLKDHATLFQAFRRIAAARPRATLLLVGPNLVLGDPYLEGFIAGSELRSRVVALGPRDDVPRLMNAMDTFLLTSTGEGFPNVVAEALATAVPCVVTDCGDAADMVADTGWVRAVGDSEGLAVDVVTALGESPDAHAERGRRARQRVVERYGIEQMRNAYEAGWRGIVAG